VKWSRPAKSTDCEFINVESEFAAMSVAIGSSATGARTYTATASQGILFMAEAVYNASGLGLPIVMTVANRAIGAPINIWNDHTDALSQRDSGWIQLFAETNQEALDLHIQAFKLAEEVSLPVMVCMDGFILTHAYERVDVPTQEQVDAFLPPYEPRQVLDPDRSGIDRRDGRPGSFLRSALPGARQADAGAGTDPASWPNSSRRSSVAIRAV
jgi:pyruvate ferredoxin oxidoreductase alpha subunit